MTRDLLRQIVNLLLAIATIAVNFLAVLLPLNGQNTGAISDRFRVYFVPAGYVFSIWGLIYIGILAFAIYQVLPSQRTDPDLRRIGYLFALSCIANIVWLFCWHYNYFPLSLLVMLVLLCSLIAIYLRLDIGRKQVSSAEKWCVHIPISVYLGWITVATLANATEVLYYLNWSGWGIAPQVWAGILLAVAVVITGWLLFTRRDVAYALVILWAVLGIAYKQLNAGLVAWLALLAASTLLVMLLVVILSRTKPPQNRLT
jgi:TspO/MBR family